MAAAIIGALYAMRRRKRHNNQIAESDRYPPSYGGSMIGGYAGGALGKTHSHTTSSEMAGSHRSPQMRESNPLDRYATPGISSNRTSLPQNSRTSDISSVSGSEPNTYRPGPGMPAVAEQARHPSEHELPEQNNNYNRSSNPDYLAPDAAYGAAGNPFAHEKSGGDTPSLYSDDGDNPSGGGLHHRPSVRRQQSPAALELSGEDTVVGSGTSSPQGYRGVDPEQPYHTRSQLQKPPANPRTFDPSHNF